MGGKGSGGKPREYPADIIELVRHLYESGMTVKEIKEVFPKGYHVRTLVERYVPERRRQVARNQRGEANNAWNGENVSYQALHLRVTAQRGKPSLCERCGKTEGRFEWANLTGRYDDVSDYERLCVSCHRFYDAERRAMTGQRTMPKDAWRCA